MQRKISVPASATIFHVCDLMRAHADVLALVDDENSSLVHGHLDDGAILCTCRNLGHGHYVMPGCPQCSYHTKVAAFVSQEAHSCLRLDQHRLFVSQRICGIDDGGLDIVLGQMRVRT